jgi:hypothetical protein
VSSPAARTRRPRTPPSAGPAAGCSAPGTAAWPAPGSRTPRLGSFSPCGSIFSPESDRKADPGPESRRFGFFPRRPSRPAGQWSPGSGPGAGPTPPPVSGSGLGLALGLAGGLGGSLGRGSPRWPRLGPHSASQRVAVPLRFRCGWEALSGP